MTVVAVLPNRQLTPELLGAAIPNDQFVATAGGSVELLKRAEVMIGSPRSEGLDTALQLCPDIRWFASMAAGIDRLITAGIVGGRRDLVVTNNRGSYDIPIADHAIALMYAAARNLHGYGRAQRDRKWIRIPARHEVRDATMVVYGLGSIGSEVARVAVSLGMRVIGVRRNPPEAPPGVASCVGPDAFEKVVAEADYVVICAPLTPETRGAISAKVIARMKPTAWIINVARGAIVDEGALIAALREGRIGGAALDVFEAEPLPADHVLWALDNVIVTPHSATTSPKIAERTVRAFAANLERFKRGLPLTNVIDPSAQY